MGPFQASLGAPQGGPLFGATKPQCQKEDLVSSPFSSSPLAVRPARLPPTHTRRFTGNPLFSPPPPLLPFSRAPSPGATWPQDTPGPAPGSLVSLETSGEFRPWIAPLPPQRWIVGLLSFSWGFPEPRSLCNSMVASHSPLPRGAFLQFHALDFGVFPGLLFREVGYRTLSRWGKAC